MKNKTVNNLYEEIIKLNQQIDLAESNYKYAIELQTDSHALMQSKDK